MDWRETDKIYNSKTRDYFSEVLSDYTNGNYRSAVVMLYSVVISDLLFKLKELVDMYDDGRAKRILDEVETKRMSEGIKTEWEKEILAKILKETELIDMGTQACLDNLRSWRNLSAHPALNADYELLMPTKENTIALMRDVLEGVLSKPPIFINKILDVLLQDLEEKQSYYEGERDKLKEYLRRKYFSHMSDAMKKSTFRSMWKLCFCLAEDEKCTKNRVINRKLLEFLAEDVKDIEGYMKTDRMFSSIAADEDCIMQLCIFLARNPRLYSGLSDDTKLLMDGLEKKNSIAKLISWYKSNNKEQHIRSLIKEKKFGRVPMDAIQFVAEQYSDEGEISCFLDYVVEYYGNCISYDGADSRFESSIKPYLHLMNRDQIVRLISVSNENDQIYGRWRAKNANTFIVENGKTVLGSDFNYSVFPNFTFDDSVLSVVHPTKTDEEDEEWLPDLD